MIVNRSIGTAVTFPIEANASGMEAPKLLEAEALFYETEKKRLAGKGLGVDGKRGSFS